MKNISKLKSKLIPVNRPKVFSSDIKNVVKALKETWISGEGPYIKKFENDFFPEEEVGTYKDLNDPGAIMK